MREKHGEGCQLRGWGGIGFLLPSRRTLEKVVMFKRWRAVDLNLEVITNADVKAPRRGGGPRSPPRSPPSQARHTYQVNRPGYASVHPTTAASNAALIKYYNKYKYDF